VTRAGHTESVHYGSVVVVDRQDQIIAGIGDPDFPVFTRSCSKPLQAIPLFSHPHLSELGLTDAELAITCGSHSGEPRHLDVVRSILDKATCRQDAMQCGSHVPMYFEALGRKPAHDDVYSSLHHNCSGKHAGMLAWCRLSNVPLQNYLQSGHQLQREILRAVAHFSGVQEQHIDIAVDGCGAPNFRLPLRALALAYMRLSSSDSDRLYGTAPAHVYQTMTQHPEMIAGLRRIDLLLMQRGAKQWLSKVGAEAVHALGIKSKGYGIAIKIADGGQRARSVVTLEVLKQLGLLTDLAHSPLAEFARPEIRNDREQVVGDIQPIFKLRIPA
jgi:L-asparaginase II